MLFKWEILLAAKSKWLKQHQFSKTIPFGFSWIRNKLINSHQEEEKGLKARRKKTKSLDFAHLGNSIILEMASGAQNVNTFYRKRQTQQIVTFRLDIKAQIMYSFPNLNSPFQTIEDLNFNENWQNFGSIQKLSKVKIIRILLIKCFKLLKSLLIWIEVLTFFKMTV